MKENTSPPGFTSYFRFSLDFFLCQKTAVQLDTFLKKNPKKIFHLDMEWHDPGGKLRITDLLVYWLCCEVQPFPRICSIFKCLIFSIKWVGEVFFVMIIYMFCVVCIQILSDYKNLGCYSQLLGIGQTFWATLISPNIRHLKSKALYLSGGNSVIVGFLDHQLKNKNKRRYF